MLRTLVCVDRKGAIKSMQDGFEAALRLEWPDFDGLSLPSHLAHSLLHGAAGHHRGKRVALNSHRVGDLYYLLASSLGPLHLLTKREREGINCSLPINALTPN